MSRNFGWHELQYILRGLGWTLALSAMALTAGGVGGLIIALARQSRARLLRILAGGFILLLQGTPVLMQLFLAFYGLAVLTGFQMDPWPAVILAFTLYAAAFLGEIWQGAIEAVPRTQWEAAHALGLRRHVILLRVVAPQAVRLAIPPTVGFLVQLVKKHGGRLDHRLRGGDAGGPAHGQRHLPANVDLSPGGAALLRRLLADLAAGLVAGTPARRRAPARRTDARRDVMPSCVQLSRSWVWTAKSGSTVRVGRTPPRSASPDRSPGNVQLPAALTRAKSRA